MKIENMTNINDFLEAMKNGYYTMEKIVRGDRTSYIITDKRFNPVSYKLFNSFSIISFTIRITYHHIAINFLIAY